MSDTSIRRTSYVYWIPFGSRIGRISPHMLGHTQAVTIAVDNLVNTYNGYHCSIIKPKEYINDSKTISLYNKYYKYNFRFP